MRSRDRHGANGDRLEVSLPDYFPSSRLIVTAQYPQTMMLVLPFNEGDHLTLELGRDNNLYGLPPKLTYENPHLSEAILSDLLPPLVERLKIAYPNVEKEAKQAEPIVIKTEPRPQPTIETSASIVAPVYIPTIKERVPRLQKRLLTPLSEYLAGPKPLAVTEEVKPQNFVSYNRLDVVSHMSKNIPERIVDQVMRDIRDFEYGRGDFKKMTDIGLWEIRSGKYRIILSPTNGHTFNIAGIVARKDLDKLLLSL